MTEGGIDFGELHGLFGTIAWLLIVHLGLWSTYFKHSKYGTVLHGIIMTLAIVIMVAISLLIIGDHGIDRILNTSHPFHNFFGIFMLLNCPIILISGAICRFGHNSSTCEPAKVQEYNLRHSCYGWAMIALSKVPLYNRRHENGFIVFLMVFGDLCSTILFLYLKFLGKKQSPQETVRAAENYNNQELILFKSEKELQEKFRCYFIFAEFVYDIDQVLGDHPGGWKLIREVQGREADRFIYGVAAAFKHPEVRAHQHSERSIDLASKPLGRISIGPEIFLNISLINEARLISVDQINSNIYKLVLSLPGIRYCGYQSLESLGKFYAVSFQKSPTRLYSMVNYLQPKNSELHEEILEGQSLNQAKSEENFYSTKARQENSCIPLLIKMYGNGKFTSNLLHPSNFKQELKFTISAPRGLGLGLSDSIPTGQIVIMAAGTGLYPFSDLIDLLYKGMLIEQNHRLKGKLIQNDPVLKSAPFSRFTFSLYISVNYFAEIHPLTVYQCNQLGSRAGFKCFLKTKASNKQAVKEKYPHIEIIEDYFQNVIKNHLLPRNRQLSRVMICGPNRFSKVIVEALQESQISYDKIRII